MATKISELASASTLDGSELLPIVQGGVTKQTSITDLVSGGELPAYSTTETVTTERWTDGKPIYRQTITGNFGALSVQVTGSQFSAVVDQVTNTEWIITASDGNMAFGSGYEQGSATTDFYANYITANHEVRTTAKLATWANEPWVVTVYYTKTTDTAASPVAGVTVTGGDSGWTEITYTSSWTFQSAGLEVKYRKDASGVVHMAGLAKAINNSNVIVCNLPVGYRPSRYQHITTTSGQSGGQSLIARCSPDGNISIGNIGTAAAVVQAGNWASMDFSFYAG